MKKKLLLLLLSLASLALVSCGGGNDIASSGASAVSAATSASTPDVIPNTTATTPTVSTPTKPKINGQVDERTGVASVIAQMTIAAKRMVGSGSGYCPQGNGNTTGSCTGCSYGPPNCTDCFVSTGQQYTTTYCSNCNVCVAGSNDCIQGALGCNQCNVATGYDDGYWCTNGTLNGLPSCVQSSNSCS